MLCRRRARLCRQVKRRTDLEVHVPDGIMRRRGTASSFDAFRRIAVPISLLQAAVCPYFTVRYAHSGVQARAPRLEASAVCIDWAVVEVQVQAVREIRPRDVRGAIISLGSDKRQSLYIPVGYSINNAFAKVLQGTYPIDPWEAMDVSKRTFQMYTSIFY